MHCLSNIRSLVIARGGIEGGGGGCSREDRVVIHVLVVYDGGEKCLDLTKCSDSWCFIFLLFTLCFYVHVLTC